MRGNPHIYEINACLFIKQMSRKYGEMLTLSAVPDEEWQHLKDSGFDLVWLMGVWQRSPGARQKALHIPALRQEYDRVLPGWTDEDVAGSPYAVYSYNLDPSLGKPAELAEVRSKLNRLGLRLVLDFVPNHLAFDHPWTLSHPDWFVRGSEEDVRNHPDWFFATEKGIHLAHGRDPYFPPWTDTVQVNFYSTELRQALINVLMRISEVADGVRCDMAMLALNNTFQRVWGDMVRGYQKSTTEFWSQAIAQLKKRHPGFLFIGEAYWGLERELQQLGFDFTYDKGFYDRLRHSPAADIRGYLSMDGAYQQRSMRFIENHDEERAVTAFGRQRSLATAVILATVPGLRLFHHGQLEGRRIRLPVQLVRAPEEVIDCEVVQFYDRLLAVCKAPAFHEGEWKLIEPSQDRENNQTHRNLLGWLWRYSKQLKIVAVNYSADRAQGWLKPPLPLETTKQVVFRDELTNATQLKDASQVRSHGLYLDLAPWQAQILDVSPVS